MKLEMFNGEEDLIRELTGGGVCPCGARNYSIGRGFVALEGGEVCVCCMNLTYLPIRFEERTHQMTPVSTPSYYCRECACRAAGCQIDERACDLWESGSMALKPRMTLL